MSQTNTFDSPNSKNIWIYLIRLYVFRRWGFVQYSINRTVCFLQYLSSLKKLLRQILGYITPGSTDLTTVLSREVIFYCFQYIYNHGFLTEYGIWVWIRAAYTCCIFNTLVSTASFACAVCRFCFRHIACRSQEAPKCVPGPDLTFKAHCPCTQRVNWAVSSISLLLIKGTAWMKKKKVYYFSEKKKMF